MSDAPTKLTFAMLAARVSATAESKGFDVPTWAGGYGNNHNDPVWRESNFLAKLMLVVTEIDEAVRASEGPIEPFALELADIVIRILGILENALPKDKVAESYAHFDELVTLREKRTALPWSAYGMNPFLSILTDIAGAAESWRRNNPDGAVESLTLAVQSTISMALKTGIDIVDAIVRKNEINENRPHLHGGKARLG